MPSLMHDVVRDAALAGLREGLSRGLDAARDHAPYFEGDLCRALGVDGPRLSLFGTVEGSIKFTRDTTIVDASDVFRAPQPFNYGWAKHSPGAQKHFVYLYNPRTGGSTRNRQKLVRWVKAHLEGAEGIPDAPTKKWFDEHPDVPEGLTVDPSKTATPYLSFLIENDGDPLGWWIAQSFFVRVRRGWSA